MKSKLILPVIASLAVVWQPAQAQVSSATKPIGYQKLSIISLPGSPAFNLVGVQFLNKTLAIGTITSEAANTINDTAADFTTAFAGVSTYAGSPNLMVEITTGANAGANTEVTAFGMTSLSTSDDLSSISDPGDTYVVRELNTASSLFGPNNEVGLLEGTDVTADKIWVQVAGGGFEKLYYNNVVGGFPPKTEGWKRIGDANNDNATFPIYSTAGMIVERQGGQPTPLEVTVEGWVNTTATTVGILNGFNFLDSLFPVGATLSNALPTSGTGLNALQEGTDATADKVWMPDGAGGWVQYYYNNVAGGFPPKTVGWKKIGGANSDFSNQPLTSGIVVERLGAGTNISVTPDAGIYGGL